MILGCAEQPIPGDSIKVKFKLASELGIERLDPIGPGLREKVKMVHQDVDETGVQPGAIIYSRLPKSILHPEPNLRKKSVLASKERFGRGCL